MIRNEDPMENYNLSGLGTMSRGTPLLVFVVAVVVWGLFLRLMELVP